MILSLEGIRNKLSEKGLRVTPQRLAILEAVMVLNNHPTAEQIIEAIRSNHPNIATGTVYKVLESLVENKLLNRVKTDQGIMRYDAILENHHHLYCTTCDIIEDYKDEELDELLKKYFAEKNIKDFKVEDIVLQVKGTFKKC